MLEQDPWQPNPEDGWIEVDPLPGFKKTWKRETPDGTTWAFPYDDEDST